MTSTYIPLANLALTSNENSVTFSSIPSTFRDLVCVVLAGGTVARTAVIRFNSDSGTNYFTIRMSSNASGTLSGATVNSSNHGLLSAITTTVTSGLQLNVDIVDYSATDKHKLLIGQAGNGNSGADLITTRWANNSAINSIEIFSLSGGSWTPGSTFALYGIVG